MKKTALLLLAVFALSSCASILTGASRKVLFESNPSGAKVYVNGFEKGVTPTQIKVKAEDRIDFRIDGFKERVVVMDSKFNAVAILNGLSLLGWGIDALTGSLKRVDTQYVKVDLENISPSAEVAAYLKRGKIKDVKIDTVKGEIETVIILD